MNIKLVANHLAYLRKQHALTQDISEKELSFLRESVSNKVFVKAYMGTSPENAKWMEENMIDINFKAEKAKLGSVKVSDVEDAQNEIVNLVNLRY